jgi:TctA family transporter
MVGMWVRLVSVPYQMLFPAILVFCGIGVFSLNNTEFDIHVMAVFGLIGYLFLKLDCEPAPMLLAYILGPMMEEYMRRALLLSRGDPTVFFTRPISATLLALGALAVIAASLPALHKKREEAFRE